MNMEQTRLSWSAAVVCAISLTACAVPAASAAGVTGEETSPLDDRFYLALGSFALDTDTEVRVDGDTGRGTPVDWEQTFGEGDSTRFRIDGFWRFAERHKLRFLWFNSANSQTTQLASDIVWNDVVYPADAEVKGEFDFDVYELAYEYALVRRDAFELSGSIGLHYTELALALDGEADTGDGATQTRVREEASLDAPLPVIGLRGMWTLPHNFWVDASAQFFALSNGDYDGNLQDYRAMVTWQPRKWVGFGLGYNRFEVDVDVDESGFAGTLDWSYEGPLLSYSVLF